MKTNTLITKDNALDIFFNYWVDKNQINERYIEKTIRYPGELSFSDYDDWKTTVPEDRYKTRIYKERLDIDELFEKIEKVWAEELDENIYQEYANDFEGFYQEVLYIFESSLKDFEYETTSYYEEENDYFME